MNKRILLSLASVAASSALVVGATFAYFSDSGTSNNNVFNSGTLDMKLSDIDQTDLDNVSGTWGLASAPGDTFTGDLKIKNTGSVAANHVELQFGNVVTEALSAPGSTATIPMDSVIEITLFEWDSDGNGVTDVTIPITDFNSNSISDLDDLENQVANDFDDLAFTGVQGNDHVLKISGRLSPTLAVNQHQGDSVTMTVDVTMNQDSSQ